MKCSVCGTENRPGEKRCTACGAKLDKLTRANAKGKTQNDAQLPVKGILTALLVVGFAAFLGLGLLFFQVARIESSEEVSLEVAAEVYHAELANQAFEEGDFVKAIAEMQEVIQLSSDEDSRQQAYHVMGMSYYYQEKFDEAVEAFQQSLDIKPTFHSQVYLGDAYTMMGSYEMALVALNKANALDPENYVYNELLAYYYYRTNNIEDMMYEVENAIANGSDNLFMYELKTIGYHLLGQDKFRDNTLMVLDRNLYENLPNLLKLLNLTEDYLYEKVSISNLSLKFFAEDLDFDENNITFSQRFNAASTQYVYWYLSYDTSMLKNDHLLTLEIVYKNEKGDIVSNLSDDFVIQKETQEGWFYWGVGSETPSWVPGLYTVSILSEGQLLVESQFEVQ